MDFNVVIENIKKQNEEFINFDQICSEDRVRIYRLILKDRINHLQFFKSFVIFLVVT